LFIINEEGHTHDDIDAVFGVFSTYVRFQPVETFQAYAARLNEAFKEETMEVEVVDVMVVSDYKVLIEKCIDPHLSHLHKLEDTQLCWRFEAVQRSPDFPLGCKSTYRAYSSDKVIEFIKKPKHSCLGCIGQILGLYIACALILLYLCCVALSRICYS